MKHGKYIGDDPRLKNESALIREDPESSTRGVLAQFDSRHLREAFGWWSFYSYEFELDKEDSDEELASV